MGTQTCQQFANESNEIEGIYSIPANEQMVAHLEPFLSRDSLSLTDVVVFANAMGGELRDREGMNVWIGPYVPLCGGPYITTMLDDILIDISSEDCPYKIHCRFETLHPFTDGNGRTGRAIWLWQMVKQREWKMQRSFLHEFYYQTLRGG